MENGRKTLNCGRNQDVTYFAPEADGYFEAQEGELYYYQMVKGKDIEYSLDRGDTAYILDAANKKIIVISTEGVIHIPNAAVIVRGYMSPEKTASLKANTNLPYVNGCSTRQIIHAERVGDPTVQLLQIPAGSREQSHHIHSTTRVVFVLDGEGFSHVGMENNLVTTKLEAGMVGIFDPMTPHHFETDNETLTVIPVHIYSSTGQAEFNHPMFNGTYLMNQGH